MLLPHSVAQLSDAGSLLPFKPFAMWVGYPVPMQAASQSSLVTSLRDVAINPTNSSVVFNLLTGMETFWMSNAPFKSLALCPSRTHYLQNAQLQLF